MKADKVRRAGIEAGDKEDEPIPIQRPKDNEKMTASNFVRRCSCVLWLSWASCCVAPQIILFSSNIFLLSRAPSCRLTSCPHIFLMLRTLISSTRPLRFTTRPLKTIPWKDTIFMTTIRAIAIISLQILFFRHSRQ
jgi:hypothetical protein